MNPVYIVNHNGGSTSSNIRGPVPEYGMVLPPNSSYSWNHSTSTPCKIGFESGALIELKAGWLVIEPLGTSPIRLVTLRSSDRNEFNEMMLQILAESGYEIIPVNYLVKEQSFVVSVRNDLRRLRIRLKLQLSRLVSKIPW